MDHEQFWSARYLTVGEDYLFGTAPCRFLRTHAALFANGHSGLSIADGEGRNAVWLAEQGLEMTATEISPVALEKARKLAAGRGVAVDFVQADVLHQAWPPAEYRASFDIVLGLFVQFAGPAERPHLFAAMRDALKPGGLLVLHGYTPKQLEYRTGGPSAVENLYTPELLESSFPGFEILELHAYEAELEEGQAHRGRSALIDFVARKPAA